MKHYRGRRIEVTFDPARCLHAAECLRGLPAVFDVKRRPWIEPDAADAADVADVVSRCPSGALHVNGVEEEPEQPTWIEATAGGPLWIRGDLRLVIDGEETLETRAALCRCGVSANQPYCDGSGDCTNWRR
ncbi:MAG: (4Fe-4S)-binding protein [Solirubrobacterales bacterium]|nr:(4Fe-4S)-binding protein [Solirubrobacterales bacterium]MBV9918504.1 (4Fe-4S)-binding protein [Solirubrobacterales bacterium]